MGDLSRNFSRKEFRCKCGCGWDAVDPELVAALQRLRNLLNRPIVIRSGCRCRKHNREAGGVRESLHLSGRAADIEIKGLPAAAYKDLWEGEIGLEKIGIRGVGLYPWGLHVDIRTKKTRWKG